MLQKIYLLCEPAENPRMNQDLRPAKNRTQVLRMSGHRILLKCICTILYFSIILFFLQNFSSIEYGSSPLGFQSIQIGRDSRLMSQITNPASQQAWVLIPK